MNRTLMPLVLILAACDPTPPPEPETTHTSNAAFETQIEALEKARAMEVELNAVTTARRAQLKAVEGQ